MKSYRGVLQYLLGIAIAAATSILISAYWLDTAPVWLAGVLGGGFGSLGVALAENIGDALMFSLVCAIVMAVVLLQVPGMPLWKGVVLSAAVGFCSGKLVGGVWKEMAT